jgi:hypothetical protein
MWINKALSIKTYMFLWFVKMVMKTSVKVYIIKKETFSASYMFFVTRYKR